MSSPVALAADRRPQTGDEARARLVARNDQLEAENTNLRAETERQRKRIAELERKVEELRRKAKRQAAPFSRGISITPGGVVGAIARRSSPCAWGSSRRAPSNCLRGIPPTAPTRGCCAT
jgi:hypothetical protein